MRIQRAKEGNVMRASRACTLNREKNKKRAKMILAFTAGLIAASFLPDCAVMFLLCVALILLAITFLRCG